MQAGGRAGLRVALLVVPLLLGALTGCSDPAQDPAGRPVPPPAPAGAGTTGAAATTTPAAELRAGLTWLFVERVHLLAQAGADGAAGRAVEGLLEAGAVELVDMVGGRRAPLLLALQAEVDAVQAPRPSPDALGEAHARLAAVLAERVPTLAGSALQQSLHQATAGLSSPQRGPDGPAAAVAAGLVANALAARDGSGSTETSGVVLRADLTALLVSRTHLAGNVPGEGRLGALTAQLARRLAPEPARPGVEAALRAADTALHAAARTAAAGGAAPDSARAALQAADRDLAARLAAAVPALPADLVLRELDPARDPLLTAVVARATGDVQGPVLARQSARRAVVTAATLSAGLAEQRRLS